MNKKETDPIILQAELLRKLNRILAKPPIGVQCQQPIAIPDQIIEAVSSFDIAPQPCIQIQKKTDSDAIRSDWECVGFDIAKAWP